MSRPNQNGPLENDGCILTEMLKIVLPYAILSALWIYFSDTLLGQWVSDPEQITHWAKIKGWGFVMVTASMLAMMIYRLLRRLQRAQAVVRDSERLVRLVIDLVPHHIFAKDRLGRFLFVNREAAQACGRQPDEMMGRSERDLRPDALHVENFLRDDQEVIDRGTPKFIAEEQITYPDNQVHFLQTTKIPFTPPGTHERAVLGVAIDISERKRAEAALRESEQRLRTLGDNLPGTAIYQLLRQPDGRERYLYVSAGIEQLFGIPAPQVVADLESFRALRVGDDRPRIHAAQEASARDLTVFNCEYRQRTVDGQIKWIHGCSTPRRLADGSILWDGVMTDVTERKEAEATLRASEERFRAVVESGPDGIFIQTDRKFAYVNQLAARLFGVDSPAALLGQPVLSRIHPDDHVQVIDRIRRLNEERMAVPTIQEKMLRMDGTGFDAEVTAVPFNYQERHGALVFFRDVTEKKRLEQQLQQARKMESIGQLAGGVAHDFNNILAATVLQLELLQQKTMPKTDIHESLTEVTTHVNRAANLTRQLLQFGRRSMMQVRVLNVNEVVENLLTMLRRLIGENIRIQCDLTAQLALVEADAGMLEQILMNLLVNARDAMPKGGQITISTANLELNEAQAKFNLQARPGRFVVLSVTDTGCGMSAATLQHLFEPFFTTKDVGQGTGLGLATVHGIVNQHKGWITVESKVGQGSTFRVYLPASEKPAAPKPAPAAPEPIRGGKETILLVEDEHSVRNTFTIFLQRWGYTVWPAANGKEAIELWQKHSANVDLLFTDMIMPEGMTGIELAVSLRQSKPGLRVIICSGYSVESVYPDQSAHKNITFISKPCPPALLQSVVRQCLDQV
ncbi:MAG: PAS domain S-box protein [Verrucomicrobiota bacterium]